MNSTFSVFPATQKSLESTKIPFVLYVKPIEGENNIATCDMSSISRCSNCHVLFNALCPYSEHSWACSVCGQRNQFSSPSIPSFLTTKACYRINEEPDRTQLSHVIIIGCGDVSPARVIMQSLPPNSPVHIYILNSNSTAKKLVTVAGNSAYLSHLPKASIQTSISSTISILLSLLNEKQFCFWCRVFCHGGEISQKDITQLKSFSHLPMRIDYYIDSPIQTSALDFSVNLPGVLRTFSDFSNLASLDIANDIAASDCARPFGMQCKVLLNVGVHFKAESAEFSHFTGILASTRTVLPFLIHPPQQNEGLTFQAVQAITRGHIWDPPTNLLSKCVNVVNADFPISSEYTTLMGSVSSTAVFDALCRQRRISAIDKIGIEFDNLKPLYALYQSSIKPGRSPPIDVMECEFFALCEPVTWRFVLETFIETWKDKTSDNISVIIMKKYPNVKFAIREGLDVTLGDAVLKYVELCKPLRIHVEQLPFQEMSDMLKKYQKSFQEMSKM